MGAPIDGAASHPCSSLLENTGFTTSYEEHATHTICEEHTVPHTTAKADTELQLLLSHTYSGLDFQSCEGAAAPEHRQTMTGTASRLMGV